MSNNLYNSSNNNNRGYRGPLLNILNIQEAIPNKFILCHLGIWTTKCHHKCSLSHMKGSHRGHRVNKTIKMHNVRKMIYFLRKNSWALDRKTAQFIGNGNCFASSANIVKLLWNKFQEFNQISSHGFTLFANIQFIAHYII